MTSPLPLPVLRQLLNQASALPWDYSTDSCDCGGGYPCSHEDWPHQLHGPKNVNASANFERTQNEITEVVDLTFADVELIVAAVNNLPALLDRLERQAAAIEAVQELAEMWEELAQTNDELLNASRPGSLSHARRSAFRDLDEIHAQQARTALSGITPTTEET